MSDNEQKVVEMTDKDKSILLAHLMGRAGMEYHHLYCPADKPVDKWNFIPDLYSPANMALAWRVLNWAYFNPGEKRVFHNKFMRWVDIRGWNTLISFDPSSAQRIWLDKVVEVALDTGMAVTPLSETP